MKLKPTKLIQKLRIKKMIPKINCECGDKHCLGNNVCAFIAVVGVGNFISGSVFFNN